MDSWLLHIVFFAAGCVAGIINAVAGGGPILTLGILSLTGLDPRIANLTSTVALSPGQMAAGWSVRHSLQEAKLGNPFLLLGIAVVGGAMGAVLLLATASTIFNYLVPWLVLLATGIYAASNSSLIATRRGMFSNSRFYSILFAPLALYGGYFGGGNSFLVLALLGLSGHEPRICGKMKNVLIAAVNLGAVAVFISSGPVEWAVALSVGTGGMLGSVIGARLLGRMPVGVISWTVIIGGLVLAAWMFAR